MKNIDQIITILSTKIRDRGTGHIHTAIRVLEQLKEEYEDIGKYTGHEGDYDDFGVHKIDLEKFARFKEKLKPLPSIENLEINKESKVENQIKRLNRLLDIKNIKLTMSEQYDLAIKGKC